MADGINNVNNINNQNNPNEVVFDYKDPIFRL